MPWTSGVHGPRHGLEADELIAEVPELAAVSEAVPVRHRAVSSADIGATDWLALNTWSTR